MGLNGAIAGHSCFCACEYPAVTMTRMRPRAVVKAWVEAFNRADVEALTNYIEKTPPITKLLKSLSKGATPSVTCSPRVLLRQKWCASRNTYSRTGSGPFLNGATRRV